MYCKHCGKEIDDDSKVCSFCGKGIDEKVTTKATTEVVQGETSTIGVLALVFGALGGILGIIFGIIGLVQYKTQKYKTMSLLGLIFSIAWILIMFLLYI